VVALSARFWIRGVSFRIIGGRSGGGRLIASRLQNRALHLGLNWPGGLLRHGFTGCETVQALVKELVREHIPWTSGISLVREARQGLIRAVERAVSDTSIEPRTMPSLDQMNEQELIAELHRLAADCERLNFNLARATQRQRFCQDGHDAAGATRDEQVLLAEMNRLMDRRRAVEGHLMRVRGQLRPLRLHE
jgi:hypothetical protein